MSGENTVVGLLTRQPDQPYGSDKDAGEIEQHDDYCFIASGLRVAAEHITNYGNRNWWHFDLRTWSDYMEMFRGNLFQCAREWLRTTRQPYHKAIIELQAQGSTDIVSYLHLAIVIFIEFFKSGTSGKLILWAFAETQYSKSGKALAGLFKFGMRLKNKSWKQDIFDRYYGSAFPEHAEFARVVFSKE